jgi:hypothetical protein
MKINQFVKWKVMYLLCNIKNNFHIIFKDPRFRIPMTELSNTVDRTQAYP